MANIFTKIPFSASTHYRGVKVVATATAGTTIHTAQPSASLNDEVYLWIFNYHTADVTLTIEFGGVSAPDDNIVVVVPFSEGLVLVVPGLVLRNSLVMKAFASVANVLVAFGHVIRES